MDTKTPGVFIEELALLPPSVASVATAVPAFIGHTAITVDSDGQTLINRPVRVTSLVEYTALFGGEFSPAAHNIQLDAAAGFSIVAIEPENGKMFYLYDCVRHYFDNGGGPCYIVSVGGYSSDVDYGDTMTGLRGGLFAVEKVDEPTLLAIPDAVNLRLNGAIDFTQIGTLHADVLEQCNKLLDRFGILDLAAGGLPPGDALSPIDSFRNQVGTNSLKYGAVYYPWLCSTYFRDVHFTQFNFLDNSPVPVPIPDATINTLTGDGVIDGLVTTLRSSIASEQNVFGKLSTVSLDRTSFQPLSSHFTQLQTVVLDATNAVSARPAFLAFMSFIREMALAFHDIEDDPGIPVELSVALAALRSDVGLRSQIAFLVAFEKNVNVMDSIALGRQVADVESDYNSLDNEEWLGSVTLTSIAADVSDFTNSGANSIAETAHDAARSSSLRNAFDEVSEGYASLLELVVFYSNQAEINLFNGHPFFKSLLERVRKEMSLIPPSGAIAGIYAATDRTRGVWKAPANVSLRAVVAPAYKLTDREQGDLNVHSTGKSINGIRAFTGKGILVWGARTLAGNDNEWRYINVRRFFTYVEESVKKASEPFVFENNDANTWIRVRAMIENFLTLQWRQGALAGATPKDAFFVKLGLGETMTAQDILEGRMIVEIGIAAVRPAEFIILKFSHKMQKS